MRVRLAFKFKLLDNVIAQPGIFQHQRHIIDVIGRFQRDHRARLHVAEQRDLVDHILADRIIGARDDHLRLDTDAAQFADAVLGRFGF